MQHFVKTVNIYNKKTPAFPAGVFVFGIRIALYSSSSDVVSGSLTSSNVSSSVS